MPTIAAASGVEAERFWVNAGFYSAHFDSDKGLRNANPGLGFEYRIDNTWSATAGLFRNSDNADSRYMGVYYQPWTWAGRGREKTVRYCCVACQCVLEESSDDFFSLSGGGQLARDGGS